MTWIRNDGDDSSDSDSDSNTEINVIGSSVYFYSDVSDSTITKLITELKKLEISLMKKALELDGYKPKIKLYIRSCGGEVYAGFSAMDHISALRVPVVTIADGFCASAATFLLARRFRTYNQEGGNTGRAMLHAHTIAVQGPPPSINWHLGKVRWAGEERMAVLFVSWFA